jgi:hypothetical protein
MSSAKRRERQGCGSFDRWAESRTGLRVITTGTTMLFSLYLTVILAFPMPTAETVPSLDTVATVGRSEV